MNMKRIVTGLLMAMALLWAPAVYAADNSTEFGVADDLTVLGGDGTATLLDPDVAVSYTHLRAHETVLDLVCRLLLEKKKK